MTKFVFVMALGKDILGSITIVDYQYEDAFKRAKEYGDGLNVYPMPTAKGFEKL